MLAAAAMMSAVAQDTKRPVIAANPMVLNYRFQPLDNDPARREAADPVCEFVNGKYYLFASKSGGYWSSENLADWKYIPAPSIGTINDYAPTILWMDGTLYYMASDTNRLFKTTTPDDGNSWVEVESKFPYADQHDPSLFRDDDGKVYLYWGCHDVKPIVGVEVDPRDGFKPKGVPDTLILHNTDKYGWEVPGHNNEETFRNGWNEGPAMLKRDGKYYLQYAGPGTQYRIYADGIYVSDNPLGPFTYCKDNPFSIKPGGFIGAAGHGHTFADKYGNLWHVASMLVGVRHRFERRLGLFPVMYNPKSDNLQAFTLWSDYPFVIPQEKADFSYTSQSTGWKQLAEGKTPHASSFLMDHRKEAAVDETIETWWSAATGKPGEWFMVDLGRESTVNAIQMNFADEGFELRLPYEPVIYRYVIEGSKDGKNWQTLADKSANTADLPHELFVLDTPRQLRYVRVTNRGELPAPGKFSLYDLRVFGTDNTPGHASVSATAPGSATALPEVSNFKAERDANDRRIYNFTWDPTPGAQGYIIYWGSEPDNLCHAMMVRGTSHQSRFFDRDAPYHFRIEPF